MVRKYSVKSRYYKKSNWSHENKGCNFDVPATQTNGLYQNGSVIVPAINTQGIRTVGNWNITVPCALTTNGVAYWALVFVPQGTSPNALFSTTGTLEGSLYEPNQFVIASGISESDAGPIRIRSKIMRKLNSGDQISLIIGTPTSGSSNALRALVSYSIKYN